MSEALQGQCLCGAVKVSVVPESSDLHACHCDMCRAWTGAAFVGFDVAPGDIEATGPVKTRETSDWARRAWCDDCGSTLWSEITLEGHENFNVAVGLLRDASGMTLTREIFIDRKTGGYAFAGDHEKMTNAEIEAMFADIGGSDE